MFKRELLFYEFYTENPTSTDKTRDWVVSTKANATISMFPIELKIKNQWNSLKFLVQIILINASTGLKLC